MSPKNWQYAKKTYNLRRELTYPTILRLTVVYESQIVYCHVVFTCESFNKLTPAKQSLTHENQHMLNSI